MNAQASTRTLAIDARVSAALRVMGILSPQVLVFAGQQIPVTPHADATGRAVPPDQAMIAALQARLYAAAYNRPFDPAAAQPQPELTDIGDELSRANPGGERWDHGWQVYQALPNGAVNAHKHGRATMFLPGQYMAAAAVPGTHAPVQPGTMISGYLAKELRNQGGFYIALGEQVQPYYEQASLVRVYWNVRQEGAAPLLHALVSRFNRFQVPFRFKTLTYRQLYGRFDAGVLFVGRRRWDITARLVAELYAQMKPYLDPDVPSFTRTLAPGLSFAEDPGSGDSFGTSRCRLIAEGLWRAYQRGQQTDGVRYEEIAGAFTRAGLSLERPWLNPGSVDTYDFHVD
jgi:hypothetical protein